jgi:hypothetical protein
MKVCKGKFLKFTNGKQVIYTKKTFFESQQITKHRLETLVDRRLEGSFYLDGKEWNFKMMYGYEDPEMKVNKGGRQKGETGKKWSVKKTKRNKVLSEERINKNFDEKLFYTKIIGNFVCKYCTSTDRLVSTSWLDGDLQPFEKYIYEGGKESIIDQIYSGEIFRAQKMNRII